MLVEFRSGLSFVPIGKTIGGSVCKLIYKYSEHNRWIVNSNSRAKERSVTELATYVMVKVNHFSVVNKVKHLRTADVSYIPIYVVFGFVVMK